MWEISHLDPPQAIEYTRVHVQDFIMQKANENEKDHHVCKHASI